jgi:O-antigen/teichoic acid export membrane protein
MIEQARRLLDSFRSDPQVRGHMLLLGIVGIGAAFSFAMFALIARYLGPDRFGRFAAVFNGLSFLSVIAARGQETLIGRSWNEYAGAGRTDLAGGALVFGFCNALGGALAAAALILVIGVVLDSHPTAWLSATVLVLVQTVLSFTTSASRGIAGVLTATGNFELTWRLLTIVAVSIALGLEYRMGEAGLFAILALGMATASAAQTAVASRSLPATLSWSRIAFDRFAWRRRSRPMWAAAILEGINQYSDVVLIGLLIDTYSAGAYFVALRVANAFAKVTLTVSELAASRISLLYFNRPRKELVSFTRSVALLTAIVVAVGLAAVIVFGPLLLWIFGPTYTTEFGTVMILALGTATVALSGPAPFMLLHTGHERLYTYTIAIGLAARVLLFVPLTVQLGTVGAAMAFTFAAVAVCIVLNIVCRRLIGVDPSVFCLARRL